MRLAALCHHCGEPVQVRSSRPAVFVCVGCGGNAELLNANENETQNANSNDSSTQPRRRYVAMDGTIVYAGQRGEAAECTADACQQTKRQCRHAVEATATLRAGAEL